MRAAGSDGYITLAVLVVSGILAALVSSLILIARPALDQARIGADETVADAMVDGGLAAAGYLLFAGKKKPAEVNGLALRFTEGRVTVTVADEGGRIDINTADPALLGGLYAAVGGTSLDASTFAARVIDWRDEDSETELGGAEAFDYEVAELPYQPRNAPFGSVAELRFLLQLSAKDFARLAPYVTVFSRSAQIDAISAPRTVLRAVPQIQPGEIDRLIAARDKRPIDAAEIEAVTTAYSEFFRSEPSGVYRVTVKARSKLGRDGGAEAVIVEPRGGRADFSVVAWAPLPASR